MQQYLDSLLAAYKQLRIRNIPEQELADYLAKIPQIDLTRLKSAEDSPSQDLAITELLGDTLSVWLRDNACQDKIASKCHVDDLREFVGAENNAERRLRLTAGLLPLLAPLMGYEQIPGLRAAPDLRPVDHRKLKEEIEWLLDALFHSQAKCDFQYNDSSTDKNLIYMGEICKLFFVDALKAGIYDRVGWLNDFYGSPESPVFLGDRCRNRFLVGLLYSYVRNQLTKDDWSFIRRHYKRVSKASPLFEDPRFWAQLEHDDELFATVLAEEIEYTKTSDRYYRGLAANKLPVNRQYEYVTRVFAGTGRIFVSYFDTNNPNKALYQWYGEHIDHVDVDQAHDRRIIEIMQCYIADNDEQLVTGMDRVLKGLDSSQYATVPNALQDVFSRFSDSSNVIKYCAHSNAYVQGYALNAYLNSVDKTSLQGLYTLVEQHPDVACSPYRYEFFDPEIFRHAWQGALNHEDTDKIKTHIIRNLFQAHRWGNTRFPDEVKPGMWELGLQLYTEDPEFAYHALHNQEIPIESCQFLVKQAHASMRKNALFGALLAKIKDRDWPLMREPFQEFVSDLVELPNQGFEHLLKLANTQADFNFLSPQVLLKCKKTKAKEFVSAVTEWLSRFSLDSLEQQGWLDPRSAVFKSITLDILLERIAEPKIQQTLQALLPRIKTPAIADQVMDHLEQAGVVVEQADDVDLESVERTAAQQLPKRLTKTIVQCEPARMSYAPLSESVLTWMLVMASANKDEPLPRSVRQALGFISAEQQAALAQQLVDVWMSNNGDSKFDWIGKFVEACGDDRLVPVFMEGVKNWNKRAKPKANKMITQLGRLNTIFALSQVKTIYEGKYSDSILSQAAGELNAAAKRRKISLPELMEELTPTLGYERGGLQLDVGPRSYRGVLQGDGKLLFVRDDGRKFKSFPKLKSDEDQDLYDQANSKVKIFRKNIRAIVKQQAANFQRSYHLGKTWKTSRWKQLYLEHALMFALGQGLVWEASKNGDDSWQPFRISEDGSLIDVEDNPRHIEDTGVVRMWHPLDAAEQQVEAWKQHIKDYELNPPIDQFTDAQPVPDEVDMEADKLSAYQGYVLNQATFKSILQKNGFFQGPVEDGASIYSHYLDLPAEGLHIEFSHTRIYPWYEPDGEVAIDSISFSKNNRQAYKLAQIPSRTLAWLCGILEQCADRGSGFNPDWTRLS